MCHGVALLGDRDGKGPHDGVGACLKQVIQKEQSKVYGIILRHASTDVVDFLRTNMSLHHVAYAIARRQLQQMFWEIKVGDVKKNHGFDCKTIIGSHSMHSIHSTSHCNNVLLQVKDFSYFYCHCINGTLGVQVSIDYVKPWKLVTLEPCDTSDVLCAMELDDLT
jgi:hypothetical protein